MTDELKDDSATLRDRLKELSSTARRSADFMGDLAGPLADLGELIERDHADDAALKDAMDRVVRVVERAAGAVSGWQTEPEPIPVLYPVYGSRTSPDHI